MKKCKILITDKVPQKVVDYVAKYCDYEIWDNKEDIPRELLYEKIKDKEGLLTYSNNKIDKELLDHAPKLRIVSNMSVGYDNFIFDCMKERNVIGTNSPGVLDDTVADLIFGLMLSCARRISELDSYVKELKWNDRIIDNYLGLDVHHSTLGIIGMGRIGEAVAKRAMLGFDMNVLYNNRNRKYEIEKSLGVKYSSFESLLKKSDFIVVMTPLNDKTYHLIDYKEFDMMKKTAILVNASRGATVNEKALIDALKKKKIYGAGLDVFEQEPINTDNPLLKLKNAVLVPHIGPAVEKTRTNLNLLGAKNLVIGLSGTFPPNVVPELKCLQEKFVK